MNGESSSLGSETDRGRQSTAPGSVLPSARGRGDLGVAVAAIATLVLALRTVVTVTYNLPFDPVEVPQVVRSGLAVGAAVTAGLALVVLALLDREAGPRIGLLFAGVFGVLAVVDRAATVPAVLALTGGSALALLGGLGRPRSYRDARLLGIATAFVVGIAVSVASTTGILAGELRGLGGAATLLALFGVGIRAESDRIALVVGALAALGLTAASLSNPFAVGSTLLVTFSVVGVPHLLVALALGGATAALVAGIRRGAWALAVGGTLLVLAGVPATVPDALAVLLGATLVLLDPGANAGWTPDREVTA